MQNYVYNSEGDTLEQAIRRTGVGGLKKPTAINPGTVIYSALNAIDKKIWQAEGGVPEEKKDSAIYHSSDVFEVFAIALQGFMADITRSYLLVAKVGNEFALVGGLSIDQDTYRNKIQFAAPKKRNPLIRDTDEVIKMVAQQKWCHLEFVNSEKK